MHGENVMDVINFGQNKILVVKVGEKIKDNQNPQRNLTSNDMSSRGNSNVLKDRTLGWWCVRYNRAQQADYIIGVEAGTNKVVSAYNVKKANLVASSNNANLKSNRRKRYGFDMKSSVRVTNINGISLFPNVVLTNYKFVDSSGNTRKASNPFTYINL